MQCQGIPRSSLVILLGALTLLVTVHTIAAASFMGKGLAVRNRRHVRHANDNDESFYPLLCPKVVCLPLPRGCREIEMIVFEYSRIFNGKVVEVRCESCEYCMDMPFRRRRSLAQLLEGETRCPDVSCPLVPNDCEDVRTTDIFVGEKKCAKTCPACYDGTMLANEGPN